MTAARARRGRTSLQHSGLQRWQVVAFSSQAGALEAAGAQEVETRCCCASVGPRVAIRGAAASHFVLGDTCGAPVTRTPHPNRHACHQHSYKTADHEWARFQHPSTRRRDTLWLYGNMSRVGGMRLARARGRSAAPRLQRNAVAMRCHQSMRPDAPSIFSCTLCAVPLAPSDVGRSVAPAEAAFIIHNTTSDFGIDEFFCSLGNGVARAGLAWARRCALPWTHAGNRAPEAIEAAPS